jgi:hypothetical protein
MEIMADLKHFVSFINYHLKEDINASEFELKTLNNEVFIVNIKYSFDKKIFIYLYDFKSNECLLFLDDEKSIWHMNNIDRHWSFTRINRFKDRDSKSKLFNELCNSNDNIKNCQSIIHFIKNVKN